MRGVVLKLIGSKLVVLTIVGVRPYPLSMALASPADRTTAAKATEMLVRTMIVPKGGYFE